MDSFEIIYDITKKVLIGLMVVGVIFALVGIIAHFTTEKHEDWHTKSIVYGMFGAIAFGTVAYLYD